MKIQLVFVYKTNHDSSLWFPLQHLLNISRVILLRNTYRKYNSDAIELGEPLYFIIWLPFTAYFHISMIGNMIVQDDANKIKFFGENYHTAPRSEWMYSLDSWFCNHFWVIPNWTWLKIVWVGIAKVELKIRLFTLLVRWIYLLFIFAWSFTIKSSIESKLYCAMCITQWLIVMFHFGTIRFGTYFIVMIIPIIILLLILKCWKDSSLNEIVGDLNAGNSNENLGKLIFQYLHSLYLACLIKYIKII